MRLPIPIFSNEKIYREIEIKKPNGAVLADTKKATQKGDVFLAVWIFISGCTSAIEDITDKQQIKSLISKMPYRSAEAIAIKIMSDFYSDDDGIEGVYQCPRCKNKIISELKEEDGIKIDTRDFISQLHIGYCETDSNVIDLELSESVKLKNSATDEIIIEVNSLSLQFPTIENCMSAFKRIGLNDEVRLQYMAYVDALISINGEPIDQKWKNMFGLTLFEGMKDARKDIGKIADEIKKYGIDTTVEKRCNQCEKVWRPSINTTNFFASALGLS